MIFFMLLSVIFYFIFLLGLLVLPDKFWSHFLSILLPLKKAFHDFKVNQKHKSHLGRAEHLQSFMTSLENQLGQGQTKVIIEIPIFGFYTELIEKLIAGQRKYGLTLKSTIQELKLNLIREIQFEKKCKTTENNGKFQFVMMAIVTWFFIFFTGSMVEIHLNFIDVLIILLLQISGAFIFFKFSKFIKIRQFQKFSEVIERLYLFTNMVELGLSNGKAISESKVLEGSLVTEEVFLLCASRLQTAILKWRDAGVSPKSECKDLLDEVWHQKTMAFEQYLKQLEGLKFSVLACFYLPAYFYYLYSIFQFFMEQ